MQLHGFVVDKSILQRPNTLDYRFKIKTEDYSVLADYTGVVPDTFKDGAEVVLSGRLGPDGFKAIPTVSRPSVRRNTKRRDPAGSAIR